MIKVLQVFTNESPSDDYNGLWRTYNETREEFTKGLKLDLMYLFLTKINTKTSVNSNMLKILERELTSYDISFSNTIKYVNENICNELLEDPTTFDIISQIQSEDIADEKKEELAADIADKYFNAFEDNFANNAQSIIIAKPIDNIFYDVITLLPELFFTPTGYKYIPEEYRIYDEKLREECYEYVVDSIHSYRNYRIDDYGREKFGILKDESIDEKNDNLDYEDFDDDDILEDCFEEFDELDESDNYEIEEWVIDTQFTGYSGLYHSIKIISIVLNFIKNKQYDKLKKFIAIDEYIKRESERVQGSQDYYTLVEILYNTRSISEFDLNKDIFISCKNDKYLEFFLSDKLSEILTDRLIGRLILYYFDSTDELSISQIKKNLDNLPMRKILRPKEPSFDCQDDISKPIFRPDDPQKTLFNADIMCEEHAHVTVVYNDNDEEYIPDCTLFDYIILDCKENINFLEKEVWKKIFDYDKPIIFINTSYMFSQFEIFNNSIKTENKHSGAYLWAEYFYKIYRESFWLRDKSKLVFVVSEENSDEILKYKCGGLSEELIPYYFKKNKDMVNKSERLLTKKLIHF